MDTEDFVAGCDFIRGRIELYGPSDFGLMIPVTDLLVGSFLAMPGNRGGGTLHVVLDDSNMDDGCISGCIAEAKKTGDQAAAALGRLLLAMPPHDRYRLGCVCACGCASMRPA